MFPQGSQCMKTLQAHCKCSLHIAGSRCLSCSFQTCTGLRKLGRINDCCLFWIYNRFKGKELQYFECISTLTWVSLIIEKLKQNALLYRKWSLLSLRKAYKQAWKPFPVRNNQIPLGANLEKKIIRIYSIHYGFQQVCFLLEFWRLASSSKLIELDVMCNCKI